MSAFVSVVFLATFCAGDAAAPAFQIELPSVKIEYPGVEYWAAIEGPDGKTLWSFAIYQGEKNWMIPLRAGKPGDYRLLRIEKRAGDQREDVTVGSAVVRSLEVKEVRPRSQPVTRTLVEAGEFRTIFAAEEPWCVNDHTIVQGPDRTWHLFGITHPKPLDFFKDPGRRLAHATADTLLQDTWVAQPPAVTADWEQYREYLLWAPHVVESGGIYYMFVCVGDKDTHRYRIHLLASRDLKTWTRSPHNPLLVDGFDARDPMMTVMYNQERYLYYTATTTPDGGNYIVARVTASDLTLTKWGDRQVVFVHPRAGTFGGPTESPFVIRRGNHFYLFICDGEWTHVYHSLDPGHWDIEDQVGRIRSHASEIIRDARGRWYITHAGWMNGPVKMAPLKWKDDQDETPTNIPAARR